MGIFTASDADGRPRSLVRFLEVEAYTVAEDDRAVVEGRTAFETLAGVPVRTGSRPGGRYNPGFAAGDEEGYGWTPGTGATCGAS